MYVLVAILVFVVLVMAISSGMDSYATAQQAQATIEVAQVAQLNAWGNLVTIGILALVIIAALALIVIVLVIAYKRKGSRSYSRSSSTRGEVQQPRLAISDLIQLEMLRTLKSMNTNTLTLPEEQSEEQLLDWLRRQ